MVVINIEFKNHTQLLKQILCFFNKGRNVKYLLIEFPRIKELVSSRHLTTPKLLEACRLPYYGLLLLRSTTTYALIVLLQLLLLYLSLLIK